MTYADAAADAQARADATGFDHGVFGPDYLGGWAVRMLPARRYRFGHERRCEVRMCSDLSRCRPGHGPEASA